MLSARLESMRLGSLLELERCPHCEVHRPHLSQRCDFNTKPHQGTNSRFWKVYCCLHCGGAVLAYSSQDSLGEVDGMFPTSNGLDPVIPGKAREYLKQAITSLQSPAGAAMLTGSAVDAMLKARKLKKGSLYERIDKAVEEGVLTEEMGQWAHAVRLLSNEPRHADENNGLPTSEEASQSIEFTKMLAQILFVLPSRIKRGLGQATGTK